MQTRTTLTSLTLCTALLSGSALAERELTIGYQNNEASHVHEGVLAIKSKLEELSGGELTLQLFPNAQLGDFKAMNAMVQGGELDFVLNGYPDMSYVIPELSLVGAPYAIQDFEHLERVVNGSFGQRMNERFAEEGVQVLDVWYFGTRQTTSNRPIESIDDMDGLRLRVPNVPFLIAYAENAGASAAPVAFQEVYLALQTNQVDAQENPLPTIKDMKFFEVQSHIAMTNHFVASTAVIAAASTLDSLSEEERGWLQAAIEAGGELADTETMASEAALIDEFVAAGLTVTQPDTQAFRAAMQPYYDELEERFGDGAMSEILEQ